MSTFFFLPCPAVDKVVHEKEQLRYPNGVSATSSARGPSIFHPSHHHLEKSPPPVLRLLESRAPAVELALNLALLIPADAACDAAAAVPRRPEIILCPIESLRRPASVSAATVAVLVAAAAAKLSVVCGERAALLTEAEVMLEDALDSRSDPCTAEAALKL